MMCYRDLEVWRQSMDLVVLVYRHTAAFPMDEIYGLRNQVRRAAVSVPSNIAEGKGRRSLKEYLNHLSIARGSLLEVQTQVEIARRLDFIAANESEELVRLSDTVGRLLNGLMNSLERQQQG